jgi:hypothetical protein
LQAIKSLPLKNLILKNWIVHFRNEESPKAVEAAKVVGNQLYQFDLETLLLHQSVVEFLGLDNESGVKYLPPTLTVSNLPVSEGLLLDLPPELKYLKVMIDYHDYHDYLAVLRWPENLISLDIEMRIHTSSDPSSDQINETLRSLPQSLTELRLTLPFSEDFDVKYLPRQLRIFDCDSLWLKNENIPFLPRTLEICRSIVDVDARPEIYALLSQYLPSLRELMVYKSWRETMLVVVRPINGALPPLPEHLQGISINEKVEPLKLPPSITSLILSGNASPMMVQHLSNNSDRLDSLEVGITIDDTILGYLPPALQFLKLTDVKITGNYFQNLPPYLQSLDITMSSGFTKKVTLTKEMMYNLPRSLTALSISSKQEQLDTIYMSDSCIMYFPPNLKRLMFGIRRPRGSGHLIREGNNYLDYLPHGLIYINEHLNRRGFPDEVSPALKQKLRSICPNIVVYNNNYFSTFCA